MGDLGITILLTASFFAAFKLYDRYQVPLLQAVVYNYLTCLITGLIYQGGHFEEFSAEWARWGHWSLSLGLLFVTFFFLMGWGTAKVGLVPTSIAAKLSLLVPTTVSLLVIEGAAEQVDAWYVLGLVLAVAAVILSSLRSRASVAPVVPRALGVVILIFLGTGLIDTLINLSSLDVGPSRSSQALFTLTSFGIAFLSGALVVGARFLQGKEKPSGRAVLGGLLLGIPNYFSIVFLLRTLDHFGGNGALVYPLVGTGSILVTALFAVLIFKERLVGIRLVGLLLALVALFLLAWEQGLAPLLLD